MPTPPLSGRRAQAAVNDKLILAAARVVFVDDPEAPISAVAERAHVGISALYRRYPSKDALLQKISLDGLLAYTAEVEAALADEGDAWTVFARFVSRCVEGGANSLTRRLAGAFTASEELQREGRRSYLATQTLLERMKAAGALREDFEVGDLHFTMEQLQTTRVGSEERTRALRQRYVALLLDALRAPARSPMPGEPPTWHEISDRYVAKPKAD